MKVVCERLVWAAFTP
ncbi:hypothetical protein QX220_22680 [Vibrio vulnificus]|nr:hypothetical protein [Vibrio vulnificus]